MPQPQPEKNQSRLSKLVWFAGIWLASVLTLAAIGGVLKWILVT